MFVHVQSEQRASLDRQHSHKTASFFCRCEFIYDIYAFEQLCWDKFIEFMTLVTRLLMRKNFSRISAACKSWQVGFVDVLMFDQHIFEGFQQHASNRPSVGNGVTEFYGVLLCSSSTQWAPSQPRRRWSSARCYHLYSADRRRWDEDSAVVCAIATWWICFVEADADAPTIWDLTAYFEYKITYYTIIPFGGVSGCGCKVCKWWNYISDYIIYNFIPHLSGEGC